jgi:hypothetical protein
MKTQTLLIKLIKLIGPVALACLTSSVYAAEGDVYVYPAKGQTIEQTERDRYECYVWASKESGFDPSTNNAQQPKLVRVPVGRNAKEGAALTGTIIGAIAGAAIGSHDRNAGQGAIIGAAAGTLIGATIEHDGRRTAEANAQSKAEDIAADQAELNVRQAGYKRAFSACLEGRGYVVR